MRAKTKTVLIVDDEVDTVDAVAYLLEMEGYKAIRTSGGPQALELMEKVRPDLVFLDIMMPDMSGWDVLRRIRGNPSLKSVPVILISAAPIPQDRLLRPLWQEFISKPFDFGKLLQLTERLLKDSRQGAA